MSEPSTYRVVMARAMPGVSNPPHVVVKRSQSIIEVIDKLTAFKVRIEKLYDEAVEAQKKQDQHTRQLREARQKRFDEWGRILVRRGYLFKNVHVKHSWGSGTSMSNVIVGTNRLPEDLEERADFLIELDKLIERFKKD